VRIRGHNDDFLKEGNRVETKKVRNNGKSCKIYKLAEPHRFDAAPGPGMKNYASPTLTPALFAYRFIVKNHRGKYAALAPARKTMRFLVAWAPQNILDM
jgi:hypothetical protein